MSLNINDLDEELIFLAENKPKLLINILVEFLAEDVFWLKSNISQVDKATLKELVSKL